MKKIILLMAFSLWLIESCRTKHVQIEKIEEKHKESKEVRKDSILESKNESTFNAFSFENQRSFEIEITSDQKKDSVIFERKQTPSSEKIIVRGGKVKLKSVGKTYMSSVKKDTLQVNSTSVRTSENTQKTTESKSFKKEKEVKGNSILLIAYSLLLLAVIIFLAWRLKLFQKIKSAKW